MKKRKWLAFLMALCMAVTVLAGCSSSTTTEESSTTEETAETEETTDETTQETTEETAEGTEDEEASQYPNVKKDPALAMHVGFINGPTGMGAAMLMDENENGFLFGNYDFQIYSDPTEVTSKIINGELDVAAVPVNLAATLYNKTEGGVQIAAINTLGTTYLVENGQNISSMEDLEGKTVYLSGQGSVPDYVFTYLLAKSGITDCTVEYATSHVELATKIAAGEVDLAVMPEPYVSIAMSQNDALRVAIDLAEVWDTFSYEEPNVDNTLPMGCIVVRTAYLEEHEKEFKKFLDEYDNFIDVVKEDYAAAAEKAAEFGIVEDAAVAEKAYPNCHITYIKGEPMVRLVDHFLNVMYETNAKSIGGALPEDDFYYIR